MTSLHAAAAAATYQQLACLECWASRESNRQEPEPVRLIFYMLQRPPTFLVNAGDGKHQSNLTTGRFLLGFRIVNPAKGPQNGRTGRYAVWCAYLLTCLLRRMD